LLADLRDDIAGDDAGAATSAVASAPSVKNANKALMVAVLVLFAR
jgi:hypothetical protein